MQGKTGDVAIAPATDAAQSTAAQVALSQSVQSLAIERSKAPTVKVQTAAAETSAETFKDQLAAPISGWDKVVAISEQGIKKAPEGMLHALQNPADLIMNTEISVAVGAAAKLLLPEEGMVGRAFAVALGTYFAGRAAVPAWEAYQTGMHAKTFAEIKGAGNQVGDAVGGLVVNASFGFVGYKSGGEMLRGRVETLEKTAETPRFEPASSEVPKLPDKYLPTKETFSGVTVPGISKAFLKNLKSDPDGTYYGAGARYPDIMADPAMKTYLESHNKLTMSSIDQSIYQQELANEAKTGGAFGQLPAGWDKGPGNGTPLNAIDVTDGGDGSMTVGSKKYTLTDDGAPFRKLMVSDGSGDRTLIPESKDFEMQQVVHASANGADKFAVVGSQHGASVLHIYDGEGNLENQVPLPGYGTLHDVRAGETPSQLQFLYDTPISPPQALTLDLASNKSELSAVSGYSFKTEDYVTDKLLVPYKDEDGNAQIVPAFVSHARAMATDGNNPALAEIYGGFNVGPQYLKYMANSASWLERGGVHVSPVLPGDGGLGSVNYQAGNLKGVTNDVLAMTAITEKLHELGYTAPELTGVYGRSDGGLKVGMLLNSRPDLYGAAVSESPVTSVFDSPTINPDTGEYWKPNFGDPQDPTQVGWMAKTDVLNNLSAAKQYPPLLVEIGTIDGVVNVGNGITFATMRQGMNNGETVLFSRYGEGHDPSSLALQTAFLWDRLRPKTVATVATVASSDLGAGAAGDAVAGAGASRADAPAAGSGSAP
jgi:hypothetical protein